MLGRFQVKHPGLVFAGIFLLTLQMSTMFENSRRLLAGAAQIFLKIDEKEPDVSLADKCPGQAQSSGQGCLD